MHGFYRFFAWEAILALIIINIEYWFVKPFSLHQIISWLFLLVSLYLVINGIFHLIKNGKPDVKRPEKFLFGIEKTTKLVESGLFAYIRHPIYSSLLFLAWGVFFKSPSWPGVLLAVSASVFLIVTAKVEETEMIKKFGNEYHEYKKRTRLFIPYLF